MTLKEDNLKEQFALIIDNAPYDELSSTDKQKVDDLLALFNQREQHIRYEEREVALSSLQKMKHGYYDLELAIEDARLGLSQVTPIAAQLQHKSSNKEDKE